MKMPQWYIDSLWEELIGILESPSLFPVSTDSHQRAWQVKDTDKQFIVYVEDTAFHVKVCQEPILTTNEPEKVVQAAKSFKSKYLSTNE